MDATNKEEPQEIPKPNDFDNFVPWACRQFNISVDVIITRVIQKAYVSTVASAKPHKTKVKRPSIVLLVSSPDSPDNIDNVLISEKDENEIEDRILMETYYDNSDNLVRIKMTKNKRIPRSVIQVIALTVPFHKYLTSIQIDSGLNMNVLYEISKLLPFSQITEICLDCTFVSEANYYVLLTSNKLKHLSLAKCKINDEVVQLICKHLTDPSPASKGLSALNLSINRITDIGAKYLADMLRTNRQLSYLNLADNSITDEGANSIFKVLIKFPMSTEELNESNVRYLKFLKQKKDLIDTFMKDLQESHRHDKSQHKKKIMPKGIETEKLGSLDIQSLQERAKHMAEDKMGLNNYPFSPDNMETIDAVAYCLGNNTLCYLNLSYNNLDYISLKKLHEVLLTQKMANRTPKGLIRVVVEGNLLPVACPEYKDINHLLGQQTKPHDGGSKTKSKVDHLPNK